MHTESKSHRLKAFVVLTVIFIVTAIISYWGVRDAVSKTTENQALSVAEIVASQAKVARSVYADKVAGKLKQDGTGPHVDSSNMEGFVPIPAQFLKLVGLASSKNSDFLYKYQPISKWNLEPTQGLNDDFLRWAWPQLEEQDLDNPQEPIDWKPVYRFEEYEGRRVLRYLDADPASQPSCVSCHNDYERRPEIVQRRLADNIATQKVWKQHQLMGALAVTIPLDRVEYIADEQIFETSLLIIGILVTSFLALSFLSLRMAAQERHIANTEGQLVLSEQKRKDATALLAAKQDVERAFSELSGYLEGIDQHAMVTVTNLAGDIIQANRKFIERSGYSWEELKGRNHNIFNSGKHSTEFFRKLWTTILRGDVWRGEICNVAKDGELFWVDTSIVPLKDDLGRIEKFISIRIDITERKKNEEHMLYMGTHDALTGLPNRVLLLDRIRQAIAFDRRRDELAAVMFIDLDQFKIINDSLGHEIGDQLLIEVSKRLLACVRAEDTVARQGGDEFIVLLPNISDSNHAAMVAKSLVDTLRKPYNVQGNELHISASVGISIYPTDGQDVDTLLKNSDIAMYHAKETGRNNYKFFTSEMNANAEEKHKLLSHLRQAIENENFELHFQPIMDLEAGKVDRLEALLRWVGEDGNLIPPGQFIPLAEESGLIVPIGNWVINAACKQIKIWRDAGYDFGKIAVNLSARQFYQRTLLEVIQDAVKENDIDPVDLELEITEGMLMDHTDEVAKTMQNLNSMGIELSIDDFGTGYSSLSYLKRFPIETLKIDRSFIFDLIEDQSNHDIVRTIINLAHSLDMKVVAEGIEKERQIEILKEMGCDLYQGYYFSKPLPVAQITEFLKKDKE